MSKQLPNSEISTNYSSKPYNLKSILHEEDDDPDFRLSPFQSKAKSEVSSLSGTESSVSGNSQVPHQVQYPSQSLTPTVEHDSQLEDHNQHSYNVKGHTRNISIGLSEKTFTRSPQLRSNEEPPSSPAQADVDDIIKANNLVTSVVWDEENTVVYQHKVQGIPLSRRADNDYINATKLLNLTGMRRGRRDGILKLEKLRQVIKTGTIDLKGVWVPLRRAIKLAKAEKVFDKVRTIFVSDISDYYQTQVDSLSLNEEQKKMVLARLRRKSKTKESSTKTLQTYQLPWFSPSQPNVIPTHQTPVVHLTTPAIPNPGQRQDYYQYAQYSSPYGLGVRCDNVAPGISPSYASHVSSSTMSGPPQQHSLPPLSLPLPKQPVGTQSAAPSNQQQPFQVSPFIAHHNRTPAFSTTNSPSQLPTILTPKMDTSSMSSASSTEYIPHYHSYLHGQPLRDKSNSYEQHHYSFP